MELISLRCDHCGAPLDVKPSSRFVTCGFCHAQLAVHHSGNSYSTELLEELKQTTDLLRQDVADLKKDSELERLDRDWERRRQQYMIADKHGVRHVPNEMFSIGASALAAMFGVIWTLFTFAIFRPMALFGLVFIGFAIFIGIHTANKAGRYRQERRSYERQRRELMASRQPHGVRPTQSSWSP